MKKAFFIFFLFGCLEMIAQAPDPFIADFLSKWENATEYTIAFAEAMPAEHYTFRPTSEQRAFHEQLTHLCANMIWLSTAYLGGEGLASAEKDEPPTEKEEVLELMRESFEYTAKTVMQLDAATLNDTIEFFAGPMTKRKVLFLIADHLTHHRGQSAVYLRMKGVEPPRYIGW